MIAEAARRLRCKWCGKRGMRAALTPLWVKDYGSKSALEKFVEDLRKLNPSGSVE
ncbi:hypothetical protein [Vitreimonas flagellata]|uniref:hypothetical protein n=1 Tax=Vitreimonas flagellata TaxID=2560861 RepID=UPI00143005B4|nr:hypothetical protein [Vitreimonas flagellata]